MKLEGKLEHKSLITGSLMHRWYDVCAYSY